MMATFRGFFGLATVALVYLLIVFLTAMWSGRGPALAASALSFLVMNFFFTQPYHTFTVAAPADVLSLVAFIFVAEMTTRLVVQLRTREAERLRLLREVADAEILRKTDEAKTGLLSAVSHDLRTPLSAIRTATTALMQNGMRWNEDAGREWLAIIDAEASRLSRLVGNLLDLSRVEAGVLRPMKEPHDLREVVTRAVDAMRDRLRDHRIGVDIPDGPLVPLDFTQIESVLVNLLDNSGRHAPEGTEIRISARRQDREVRVQVENEGPPVPADLAPQLFHRFGIAGGQRHGTGLGLAICRGFIEAHGGRIWVERPGEPGARFAFTLPTADEPSAVGEWPGEPHT